MDRDGAINRALDSARELIAIRVFLRLDAISGLVGAETVQVEWVLLNLAANSRAAMSDTVFEIHMRR